MAESTFGCWVNLLDKGGTRGDGPYRKNVDYDSTLWRKALHKAFPNSGGKRTTVFTTVSHVRSLRNRTAHHEPLIGGVPLPGQADGRGRTRRLTFPKRTPTSCAWSSTSTRTSPPGSGRPAAFPNSYASGPDQPATQVPHHCHRHRPARQTHTCRRALDLFSGARRRSFRRR